MKMGGFELTRNAVRRSFDAASGSYDAHAVLQSRVRGLLLERIEVTTPRVVLDVGAGTGHASRALQRRFRGARVLALDIAEGMLRVAGRQQGWLRRFTRVCGAWVLVAIRCARNAASGRCDVVPERPLGVGAAIGISARDSVAGTSAVLGASAPRREARAVTVDVPMPPTASIVASCFKMGQVVHS